MAAKKLSAGILLYRRSDSGIMVLLVHPGGPYWAKKDDGAWSIPKGEYEPEADAFDAARRELEEETGFRAEGDFIPLDSVKQPSGKVVTAWAVGAQWDPSNLRSNTFSIEWPPRSGRQQEFPEVDRAEWFSLGAAQRKLLKGQVPFLERLARVLSVQVEEGPIGTSTNSSGDPQGSLF